MFGFLYLSFLAFIVYFYLSVTFLLSFFFVFFLFHVLVGFMSLVSCPSWSSEMFLGSFSCPADDVPDRQPIAYIAWFSRPIDKNLRNVIKTSQQHGT